MFRLSQFLVFLWLISNRLLNLLDKYFGAKPAMHLKAIIALLYSSCLATGSQHNCFRIGVTWSILRVPLVNDAKCKVLHCLKLVDVFLRSVRPDVVFLN